MFIPGTVIPAGWSISITTWENDGDDYKTQDLYNFHEKHIDALLALLSNFSCKTDNMGNEDFSFSQIYDAMLEDPRITPEFVKDFFDMEIPTGDISEEELEVMWNEAEKSSNQLLDHMLDLLGQPVSYDYDFMRMVDSVEVRFIPEDIIIPFLPKAVAEYDMSYQSKTKEWLWNK